MTNKLNLLLFPVLLATFLFAAITASAVFIEERLSDPEQEARAREISLGIRCLVCQNQSIMDSNAGLAKDLREIVRERVQAGDSNAEVRQYLVNRYGDWVLLDPPFKMKTVLLWVGPFVVFAFGGIAMFLFLRRKGRAVDSKVAGATFTEDEQAELDRLLAASDEEGKV